MSHCSLLCSIFVKSVAVFTEPHSDPAVVWTAAVTASARLLRPALSSGHLASSLDNEKIRATYPCLCGTNVSVHLIRRHKCLFIPDVWVGVQLSTVLSVDNTRQMTVLCLLQAGCDVLPRSLFLVIHSAASERAGLSILHADVKLNVSSEIRFTEYILAM